MKTNWKYILIVLILALLVGGGILWWVKIQEVPFTQLPEIKKSEKPSQDETADWIVVRDEKEGYEFKYPKGFDFGRDLPPEVILNNKFRESMGGNPIIDKGSITINNIQYLSSISEGFAAGSTYKDYYYTTEHNGKSFTIYFPVRFATDCRTYAYPEDQTKCENFKTTLEKMIGKVVATFKFIEKDETN